MLEATIADEGVVGEVFKRFEPEVVVHCAASYKDTGDWQGDVRTNVTGTVNLVKAALKSNVGRLIYFQTALCYGNHPVEQPITLSHPLYPEGSYAISKTAGEQYIAQSGLDFQSFRLANVYGPRNLSGPIPTFYSRLSAGKPCFVVDTRRDFVFVDDVVDLVLRAVGGEGRKGTYHISSGKDYSIRELYDAVSAAVGVERPVEERERGPDDAPTILLDPTKTTEEFGWEPTTPLGKGIEKAVRWYETHGVGQTYTHLRQRG